MFYRQSGNHLLCVGQRDDAALAMTITAMVSLAAQYPDDGAEFVVLDGTAPGTTDNQLLKNRPPRSSRKSSPSAPASTCRK